jgi:hypothetical protein
MALADPFNSVGGYTVGIPPMPIADSAGNIIAANINSANLNLTGSAYIGGNARVIGTLVANNFVGNVLGNVIGNITVPGIGNEVIFNTSNVAGGSQQFTFDQVKNLVTVQGDFIANTITLGSGINEFATTRSFGAITFGTTPNQILATVRANTVSSMDYTVIATDPIANNRQMSKLMAVILNGNVEYYEYGTIDVPQTSPGVANFKVEYSLGNVNLTVDPSASTVNYKIMITSYKE